ncbi:hypothetical protein HNP84_001160 [Thermocatellispora tengchongensis]|uniref:DUF3863 domain-containing protein n=1 Tax=Thermocatellispora tengchongensis TaxID=1073253 RepID=A0A840NS36_9ACTN|nr:DUF3863 domain-containing protein [Thermocatellispora tengchongensis]MBB5131454.1 hypothetical protein [Thermocatellispora tengchongensis]
MPHHAPGGARRLTLNSVIRRHQIEATRTTSLWEDETALHSPDVVLALSACVRDNFPGARMTWGFSWGALTDPGDRYAAIRATVRELSERHGDDVTFVPGGFFANRYATRDQVAADVAEALAILRGEFPRPVTSLLAGFLAAENIERAGREGVRTAQANIWSQFDIDLQDGDGSIAYPYYPSRGNFLVPGRGEDRIDVVSLDGWTVDLLAARAAGMSAEGADTPYNSRMGIGPIETLHRMPLDRALRQMRHTSQAHLNPANVARNGLGWLTDNYEVAEVARGMAIDPAILRAFGEWLGWLRATWPDLECPTMAELGEEHRAAHPDNESLRYILQQEGSGIDASTAGERVTWFMNADFRLGVVDGRGPAEVFDYTDYRGAAPEPRGVGERNWSLLGEINQKRTRPQDRPVPVAEFFAARPALAEELAARYAGAAELEVCFGTVAP